MVPKQHIRIMNLFLPQLGKKHIRMSSFFQLMLDKIIPLAQATHITSKVRYFVQMHLLSKLEVHYKIKINLFAKTRTRVIFTTVLLIWS